MDDLYDEPQKVAQDIIDQATKDFKFRQSAIDRILQILESLHQTRQKIAELQEQKEQPNIIFDGFFAWKLVDDQQQGPYCAACYTKTQGKELIRLINVKEHSGYCAKCNNVIFDSKYDKSNRFKPHKGGSWMAS